MKRIFVLFLLLTTCVLAQKADSKSVSSPDRRAMAAAAVVSHIVNNRPAPPLVYIEVKGLDAKDVLPLVRAKPATGTLKAGNNCAVKGQKLVDKTTGESCEFFSLSFTDVGDQQATVRVWWQGPNLEWTIWRIVVKYVKDKWEIADEQVELVP